MPTIPYYNSKGQRIAGTTTIIDYNLGWSKEPLNWWNYNRGYNDGKEGREANYKGKIQEAADAGTLAHYMIECDIKGVSFDVSVFDREIVERAEKAYSNFIQWKRNVKFEAVAVEPHLISEAYQYGLTPDCVARINYKIALYDWKSGSGIYSNMPIQMAAYWKGWDENNPDMPIEDGAYLLRLDKEFASFTYKYFGLAELEIAWGGFLNLLELHKIHKTLDRLVK